MDFSPVSLSPPADFKRATAGQGIHKVVPSLRVNLNMAMNGSSLASIRALSQRGKFPAKNTKVHLPMTNESTRFVSFRVDTTALHATSAHHVDVLLECFSDENDVHSLVDIPLTGATLVARTWSGTGPCLFLGTTTGTFEFQCTVGGPADYDSWESRLRQLGVKVVLPNDLFSTDEMIGEGSFAQVYSGVHKATGKSVVIKRVPKEKLLKTEHHPTAVHIEIDVLRRIHHPFIIQFQAAFEDDFHFYIILEKLGGGSLYDWLRTNKVYTEAQARGAMIRIFSALAALKTKDVVHRDLKLENLMLEDIEDPTSVKLIDFGLAAFMNTPRMNMNCGSAGFVAPEIIGKTSYGAKVDIFSAGVVLYSILCGRFPFHSDNDTFKTLQQTEQCIVSFESSAWKGISQDAKDFIMRLLTKSPENRLSAEEALKHKWIMAGANVPATIPCQQLVQPSVWGAAPGHVSPGMYQKGHSRTRVATHNAVVTRLPLLGGPPNALVEMGAVRGRNLTALIAQASPLLQQLAELAKPESPVEQCDAKRDFNDSLPPITGGSEKEASWETQASLQLHSRPSTASTCSSPSASECITSVDQKLVSPHPLRI